MANLLQLLRHRQQRTHWWQALRWWQRVTLVIVLLGALAISAGLIYVGVEVPTTPTAVPVAPAETATPAPLYPPGIDGYWYWGQNQGLDQQP
jgi:hypothetical protein